MQPAVTVKEVMRLALPEGSHLLTGNPETRIAWVRRTRGQPPAFLNLEPGELVLINTETLRLVNENLPLDRVLESLVGMGVAAVGVLGEIDQATIEQAAIFNLPLLDLPDGIQLVEVERAVTRLLIDREAQLERRAQEVAAQLSVLVAENRGLEAILGVVSQTTGKVAIVYDEHGQTLAHTAHSRVGALPVQEIERSLNGDTAGIVSGGCYIVPLLVEGRRAGYMSISNGDDQFDDLDRMTAERGAMVCAMELAKQKAVVDAETRARGDWIQRWLNSEPQDDERLEANAIEAGIDLSQSYMVTLFRAKTDQDARMEEIIRAEVDSRKIAGLVGQAPGGVMIFYPVSTLQRVAHVIEIIRNVIANRLRMLVSAGIGQPAQGLSHLRKSYREAERALQMGTELCGEADGCTIYFGDLSLYRLLLSIDDHQELQRFCDETLGPVLAYDERHDGELVHTLAAFFGHNGNLARTAEALCVHRNTLSYRLGRIAEIAGADLDDAETRLMLHLALKVRRVLKAST